MPLTAFSVHSRGSVVVAGVVSGALVVAGVVVCAEVAGKVVSGVGIVVVGGVYGAVAGTETLLVSVPFEAEVVLLFKDITTANTSSIAPPMPISVSVAFPKMHYLLFL